MSRQMVVCSPMASDSPQTPGFQPPWWLRGPHAQTIGSALMPRSPSEHRAILRRVELDDGDALAVHDDIPTGWQPGGRVAILSHGLADHHRSPLLVRLTDKLTERGVRVFRWDMRCCGAGLTWARRPYHAGCSDDLAAVVNGVLAWCRDEAGSDAPDPDLSLFGVSLSGNVLLKYLGEAPDRVPAAVRCAIAVNPPIDLVVGCESIAARANRIYDRHFTGMLVKHLESWWQARPDAVRPAGTIRPRTLRQFDDWFTAPAIGYRDAMDYYRHASRRPVHPRHPPAHDDHHISRRSVRAVRDVRHRSSGLPRMRAAAGHRSGRACRLHRPGWRRSRHPLARLAGRGDHRPAPSGVIHRVMHGV